MTIAFDLSLTCTGWCTGRELGEIGTLIPPKGVDRGIRRLQWIRDQVLGLVAKSDAQLVVLEGYSFASRGRAIISLGELGGVVRCALTDAGFPFVDVAPSCRALFATGKGNASKEQVLAEAIRRLGYRGHSNDEADALWLWTLAEARLALDSLNATQRKAIAGVQWSASKGEAP